MSYINIYSLEHLVAWSITGKKIEETIGVPKTKEEQNLVLKLSPISYTFVYQICIAVRLFADVPGRLPRGHVAVGRVPAAAVEKTPMLRTNRWKKSKSIQISPSCMFCQHNEFLTDVLLCQGTLRKVSHLSKPLDIVFTLVSLISCDVMGLRKFWCHIWFELLLSPIPLLCLHLL